MLTKFRTYQLSLELYRAVKGQSLRGPLKDQMVRAAGSICLNLAEGSAKPTKRDRLRFYSIALGSLREVQACIDMESEKLGSLEAPADKLGGSLYKLTRS